MAMTKTLISSATGLLLVAAGACANPALTIYNENFAVVRDAVHLDLKPGVNEVAYTEATMHLEPDSVVLRDPTGQNHLQILEQNYRADPISQGLLLNYYEGKTIDFEVPESGDGRAGKRIVRGKIVRSGYTADGSASQPIIEVNKKLMFQLPGEPLFPALPNDSILKPTLTWQLNATAGGPLDAELNYVTGGMSWHADYNVIAPEKGDTLDLVGWVTMDNQSGKTFREARIKLMAGDVNKLPNPGCRPSWKLTECSPAPLRRLPSRKRRSMNITFTRWNGPRRCWTGKPSRWNSCAPPEFNHARFTFMTACRSTPVGTTAGAWKTFATISDYGTRSNPKVWVMREFSNAESNHLGHAAAQGARAILSHGRRRPDGVYRRKQHRPHAAR